MMGVVKQYLVISLLQVLHLGNSVEATSENNDNRT